MNLTVSRHVNWMRIMYKTSTDPRRRRTERKETVAFDEGANECEWMWQWWLKVRGNVSYSKGLHTKGVRLTAHAPPGCRRRVLSSTRRCARTLRELVKRRGAAREHSVFGRHNANASIILDDRRLISYCRGKKSPGGNNFGLGRRVASSAILRNELPFLRPRARTSGRHVNYNC